MQVSWHLLSVTAVSQSPFTLRSQVYEWPGQKLGASVTMPVMNRAKGLAWQAFFAQLRGRVGTFWFGDSQFANKQETALGMPETVAISQGREVSSSGWDSNRLGVVKAGDWLRIGGKLRKAITTADSDADGLASFLVWPDMQAVPAATPIIWESPKGVFRLDDDVPELVWRVDQFLESFTFTIIEA
jgi:hypothetical protein